MHFPSEHISFRTHFGFKPLARAKASVSGPFIPFPFPFIRSSVHPNRLQLAILVFPSSGRSFRSCSLRSRAVYFCIPRQCIVFDCILTPCMFASCLLFLPCIRALCCNCALPCMFAAKDTGGFCCLAHRSNPPSGLRTERRWKQILMNKVHLLKRDFSLCWV